MFVFTPYDGPKKAPSPHFPLSLISPIAFRETSVSLEVPLLLAFIQDFELWHRYYVLLDKENKIVQAWGGILASHWELPIGLPAWVCDQSACELLVNYV